MSRNGVDYPFGLGFNSIVRNAVIIDLEPYSDAPVLAFGNFTQTGQVNCSRLALVWPDNLITVTEGANLLTTF